MTRTPMEQIEAAIKRVREAGYDHDDYARGLSVIRALRNALEHSQQIAAHCEDPSLRAAIMDPRFGVPTYLADAAGDVAQFFATWDDRRADRAQDERDNKAADAADEGTTW